MSGGEDLSGLLEKMPGVCAVSFRVSQISDLKQRLRGPVVLSDFALDCDRFVQLLQGQLDVTTVGMQRGQTAEHPGANSNPEHLKDVHKSALGQILADFARFLIIRDGFLEIAFLLAQISPRTGEDNMASLSFLTILGRKTKHDK